MEEGKNKKGLKAASAVDETSRALRAYALSFEDGDFIGSEEEMIARLGVSRPTLRQAAARVVQEHLITIRRGVGGGYFARRPGSITVSHMAALYLMSRNAGLSETTVAMRPLRAELAVRAARNTDPVLREQLREIADADKESDGVEGSHSHGYREFLRSEREFGKILGRMSQNSVLTLLLEILYDFTSHLRREQDVLIGHPDRVRQYRRQRSMLADAIIAGDVEIAQVAAHRCSSLIEEWMETGLENTKFDASVLQRNG